MTGLLCADILSRLRLEGFAHITQSISFSAFETIATEMGTIELRSEIKIDDGQAQQLHKTRKVKARPSPYQADALGFHSDNPTMDVLAWYCLKQDENAGSTLLIDTSDLASYFSESEMAGLGKLNLWYSLRSRDTDEEQLFQISLVMVKNGKYYVYYQPWLFLESYSEEQSSLVQKFSDYVTSKHQTQMITVKLKKHECLFIDNRRILHGRDAIDANSKRHLTRFFIRTFRGVRD